MSGLESTVGLTKESSPILLNEADWRLDSLTTGQLLCN
jgi:hypothetical protein